MSSVSSNNDIDNDDDDEEEDQQQQEQQEDLDAFLTSVESKLRGPFSSLEFARAVHTHALRGGTVVQYLKNLSTVLARTDKVIQSRILIGLLGLETKEIQTSSQSQGAVTRELHRILQQAQTSPTHEQWPRIVAGLVQGIIFVNNNIDDNEDDTNETSTEFTRPCRGAEATEHLTTLCEDVCSTVLSALVGDNDGKHNNNNHCPDLNASFVPYHYSLLPPRLVQLLIPELSINNDGNDEGGKLDDNTHPTKAKSKGTTHNHFQSNPHFHVTSHASILHLDEQLERQRAKDELEHQGALLSSKKITSDGGDGDSNHAGNTTAGAGTTPILPPGFRPTKLVTTKTSTASSSVATNMFMPKKTNPLGANRQQQMQQTMLRRKGAAQSLVNKTKMSHLAASGGGGGAATSSVTMPLTSTSTAGAATAAAARFRAKTASSTPSNMKGSGFSAKVAAASLLSSSVRNNHSNTGKMKMIDIGEVAQLEKEDANHHKDASTTAAWTSGGGTSSSTTTTLRMSKKRRIMEAAAAAKKAKLERDEQQQQQGKPEQKQTTKPLPSQHLLKTTTTKDSTVAAVPPTASTTSSATQSQQADDEWKIMLQERSNKLSDEDRERVQQFFQRRYNPTPDQTVVKMKIHEQRTTDSTTGQEIKETFYLELDYTNFSSKQSRKVKRY